jgi:Flp pilus assembly pilin Flp
MKKFFKKILSEEKSQGFVEYAYIVALLAIFCIALMIAYREELMKMYQEISGKMQQTT